MTDKILQRKRVTKLSIIGCPLKISQFYVKLREGKVFIESECMIDRWRRGDEYKYIKTET